MKKRGERRKGGITYCQRPIFGEDYLSIGGEVSLCVFFFHWFGLWWGCERESYWRARVDWDGCKSEYLKRRRVQGNGKRYSVLLMKTCKSCIFVRSTIELLDTNDLWISIKLHR